MNSPRLVAIAALAAVIIPARGDFVPGRLYISASSVENCHDGPMVDRVYEFDPLTGETRTFAELPHPHCGSMQGLAFTPDGSRLRSASSFIHRVYEIDPDGAYEQVLSSADGLAGPLGSNGIAYDQQGRFYVTNFLTANVLRFPAGAGPAEVLADFSDGILGGGALVVDPSNRTYLAPFGYAAVHVISEHGEAEVFDLYSQIVVSMAMDRQGRLFVLTGAGLFGYENGDPATRTLLAPDDSWVRSSSAMAVSADERFLFVTSDGIVRQLDLDTLDFLTIGYLPTVPGMVPGRGAAVFVPEPTTSLLIAGALALFARRRSARGF